MADVEILELKDSQIDELLLFLKKWGSNHPELGEGQIIRWQQCFRFVALHDGKIVGYIGQIPHLFKYGSIGPGVGIEQIGWGVTLVLDMSDDQVRKQAGRGLLSRCENNPPYLFSGVGIVPAIEEPYKRRGYEIRRNSTKMFARFVNPSKALAYMGMPSYFDYLIRLANIIYRPSIAQNIAKFKKITCFKPEWDSQWNDLLFAQYELYGIRTAEYLNYKLSQPDRSYQAYIHLDGGYIIFRLAKHTVRDMNLIKICDLVGTDLVKSDLISIAVKYLYEEGAYGIVALGSARDARIYKKTGLYIAKRYPIALNKNIRANMHITFFDSDLDNLW